MEEVAILPTFSFLGPAYVQHGGSYWCEEHCTRYDSHLTPKGHDLPDVIAFAIENSTALLSRKAVVSLEKDMTQEKIGGIEIGLQKTGLKSLHKKTASQNSLYSCLMQKMFPETITR